jgi:hypothetical protein
MIPELPGTPVWAVLMTTHEVDENSASTTTSAQVLAVAENEKAANDIAYELVPYLRRDLSPVLTIQQTTKFEPEPLGS